jgi:repressor LexA
MSEPLTQLEKRVYHYMIDFLALNTYQPSIREIARQFQIKSTKTVSDLLQSLESKGYIEREESRSRGVRILGFSATGNTQPVPFYGQVHTGDPALRPEHRAGFITLDRRFLPSEDGFFLKMKGDSMSGRAILDGDYVLVSPSATPKDGDLVAVRIGAETTVRTLRQSGDRVVLEASKAGEDSIAVGAHDDPGILGVVSGVFRPFWEQEASPTIPGSEVIVT